MSDRWGAVPAVGIDFGTTNSSMALVTEDARVELVRFRAREGETFSSRSVLYLEKVREASGVRRVHSWTGPAAIEHYLDAEEKGRLIQALKSYLPSRSLTGTGIFGRQYTFEDLVGRILSDLREQAERQFGRPIRHAMVGRPVRFVGAETEEDDAYAVGRLRAAFTRAGFESVELELEPVAAAYAYQSTLDHDELILIGDFGGGTSDFSLLRVGPGVRRRGRRPEDVLGNSGGGGGQQRRAAGRGFFRCADCAEAGVAGAGIGFVCAVDEQDSAGGPGVDLCEPGALALPVVFAHA